MLEPKIILKGKVERHEAKESEALENQQEAPQGL
jgi:hypothetical protein